MCEGLLQSEDRAPASTLRNSGRLASRFGVPGSVLRYRVASFRASDYLLCLKAKALELQSPRVLCDGADDAVRDAVFDANLYVQFDGYIGLYKSSEVLEHLFADLAGAACHT